MLAAAASRSRGVRKSGQSTHSAAQLGRHTSGFPRYSPNSGRGPSGNGSRRPRPRTSVPSGSAVAPVSRSDTMAFFLSTLKEAHMLTEFDLVAHVGVADTARARRFYGDVLGLPVVGEDPFAVTV